MWGYGKKILWPEETNSSLRQSQKPLLMWQPGGGLLKCREEEARDFCTWKPSSPTPAALHVPPCPPCCSDPISMPESVLWEDLPPSCLQGDHGSPCSASLPPVILDPRWEEHGMVLHVSENCIYAVGSCTFARQVQLKPNVDQWS